jgi:hypothetical protein
VRAKHHRQAHHLRRGPHTLPRWTFPIFVCTQIGDASGSGQGRLQQLKAFALNL